MKHVPTKKLRNWSVACVCSFICFLQMGLPRMSGLFYSSAITRYNVNRSQASLPFVLCYTIRNVAGPLIGYFGKKVGIQKVILSGCILSTFGVGACFFAEDIITVSALWGVVFGLGFGMSTVLIPQVLNQNFDKYLSNANGIAFGGECLAGFILPPLLKFLLQDYGTSGTFLISSGMILHSVPAALFFIPKGNKKVEKNNAVDSSVKECLIPDAKHKPAQSSKRKTSNLCGSTDVINEIYDPENASDSENFLSDNLEISRMLHPKTIDGHNNASHNDWAEHGQSYPESSLSSSQKMHSKQKMSLICLNIDVRQRDVSESTSKYTSKTPDKGSDRMTTSESSNSALREHAPLNGYCTTLNNHSVKDCETGQPLVQSDNSVFPERKIPAPHGFHVFLDPPFILMLFIQSSLVFITTTVSTIIVDYCLDIGISNDDAVYVLMCMSIADMLGRFGLGWITDGGYLSNLAFSSLCYAGMGGVLVLCVLLKEFVMVMVSVFCVGLFLGGLLIVFPGIVFDYIEEDKVTMALASRMFLYAPMSLTQSYMIGYFRETLGSYEGIFYLLAAHCLTCTALSFLIPCSARSREKKRTISSVKTVFIESNS